LEDSLFIGLIQTRNGNFNPENLGGRSANWNRKEWLICYHQKQRAFYTLRK
jgi:hypothetical protein